MPHKQTARAQKSAVDTAAERNTPLAYIAGELNRLWRLGRNTVIGWRVTDRGIQVLAVPQNLLPDLLSNYEDLLFEDPQMNKKTLDRVSDICEIEPYSISFPPSAGERRPGRKALAKLIRRYSITKLRDKAVVIFDIVRFSRYSPLEQVTAINSLSYSINVARKRAEELGLRLSLRDTTTGDGFYAWNEHDGLDGNLALFVCTMLVLVDNALGRRKAMSKVIPPLRTCFHVGNCYEYFHADGGRPGEKSYLVGDVTVSLARMSERAVPGQILIGNFIGGAELADSKRKSEVRYSTSGFVERAQETLEHFQGVSLSGEQVNGIKCYLTGPSQPNGSYATDQFVISDKHGMQHEVFNAKINVHRRRGGAIFLGRQREDLDDFQGQLKETVGLAQSVPTANGERLHADGEGTILVVEDEADLREMISESLTELGYSVWQAETGPEAVQVLGEHEDIELLFTDVVIPGGINGEELAGYARERNPAIKVLYASGYGESSLSENRRDSARDLLLVKPYRLDDMVKHVKRLLDG